MLKMPLNLQAPVASIKCRTTDYADS